MLSFKKWQQGFAKKNHRYPTAKETWEMLQNIMVKTRTIFIETLAPEPFELRKPMKVVIKKQSETEYLGTFSDAAIAASGSTLEETVINLKETIAVVYATMEKIVKEQGKEKLEPIALNQFKILKEYIEPLE